jgi:hypothetical protein
MKHAAEAEAGGGAAGWLGRNTGEAFSEGFMWRGGRDSFFCSFLPVIGLTPVWKHASIIWKRFWEEFTTLTSFLVFQ